MMLIKSSVEHRAESGKVRPNNFMLDDVLFHHMSFKLSGIIKLVTLSTTQKHL